MMLVIVSLLGLLCTLNISLGSSNQLLHPYKKKGMSLTLSPCANYIINGIYWFLVRALC